MQNYNNKFSTFNSVSNDQTDTQVSTRECSNFTLDQVEPEKINAFRVIGGTKLSGEYALKLGKNK